MWSNGAATGTVIAAKVDVGGVSATGPVWRCVSLLQVMSAVHWSC